MRRRRRCLGFFVAVAIVVVFIVFVVANVLKCKSSSIRDIHHEDPFAWKIRTPSLEGSKCACRLPSSNQLHDFCYRLPEDNDIVGKPFNCSFTNILEKLGVLSKAYIDLSIDDLPEPAFVSAFSKNHLDEGRQMLMNIRRLWPTKKVIIYDLGLREKRLVFERLCNVELRTFNFSAYPTHVSRLLEFRWKPIIIAFRETLAEFGAIWYLDSSIVFKKADLMHIYQLVECRRNVATRRPLLSSETRDQLEERTTHETGWNIRRWLDNVDQCRKSSYLFHGSTGHSIFAATHPGVYNYIPTRIDEIRKKKAQMYEAGFVFAVNTQETVENILKWYVLCALEENCMAPEGYRSSCNFPDNERFGVYAGCHRSDQSVVNLLAANAHWYDRHFYASELVHFFEVRRAVSELIDLSPFLCEQNSHSQPNGNLPKF